MATDTDTDTKKISRENLSRLRSQCDNDQEFEGAIEQIISLSLKNEERYNTVIKPLVYIGSGYTVAGIIEGFFKINCRKEIMATVCGGILIGHFKPFNIKKIKSYFSNNEENIKFYGKVMGSMGLVYVISRYVRIQHCDRHFCHIRYNSPKFI